MITMAIIIIGIACIWFGMKKLDAIGDAAKHDAEIEGEQ